MHYLYPLLLSLLLFPTISQAQSNDFEITAWTLDVEKDGEFLHSPFAGGLIAPIFNNVNFNLDSVHDIVVFDRTGAVVLPFIYTTTDNYEYAPQYKSIFPRPLSWMLMRDYDGDGLNDIFKSPTTPGIAGVEVHQARETPQGLEYRLVSQTDDGLNVLVVPLNDNTTQVYVSFIDLPGIEDLDGDGDLDIVAFDPGGATITKYRNISIENDEGEAGVEFVRDTDCFGRMIESGFSEDISISADGLSCGESNLSPQAEIRHAGSTITLFDADADGLQDALIGDISNEGIVYLHNNGNPNEAWFDQIDVDYPAESSEVKINIFNAAYYIYTEAGDKRDMIIAPSEPFGLQSSNHIWRYTNIGEDDLPLLELSTQNFLVEDMLHFGENSCPAFLDYNADGLMDIVVGSFGKSDFNNRASPRLALLENNGSLKRPSFVLKDEDYLNMSRFETTSNQLLPSTGDLDADGDIDLLIGDDRGFFYYLENIAGEDIATEFAEPVYQYQDLKLGQFVRAAIIDLNRDSLPDLIVGERNGSSQDGVIGSLTYLENIGEAGNPIFSELDPKTNNVFGNVSTKDQGYLRHFASPFAFTSEGRTMLVTGAESGRIRLHDNIDNNLDGAFSELSSDLGSIAIGENTSPAMFDIDNDGYYEMFVGNKRGGLNLFKTGIKSEVRVSAKDQIVVDNILIYPNPAMSQITIDLKDLKFQEVEITDINGRRMATFDDLSEIDLSGLQPNLYFFKIHTDQQTFIRKVVKL